MKKLNTFLVTIFILVIFSREGIAQNWFKIQGTAIKKEPVNVWGFLQPTYIMDNSELDPYTNSSVNEFIIRRARLGVRGPVPKTGGMLNYFILVETGRNGITMAPDGSAGNYVALTDASVNIGFSDLFNLRAGQFKKPVGVDGLQAIQMHNYIFFSDVHNMMVMERYGLNRSAGAFRDIGVQLSGFGLFGSGNDLELAYAIFLGNGAGINFQDNDENKDITAKITFAKIFGGEGASRKNLMAGAWYNRGKRNVYGFMTDRGGRIINGPIEEINETMYGFDLVYKRENFRITGEAVFGEGWVYSPGYYNGVVPPMDRYFTMNSSVSGHGVPHSDLEAFGWYADIGYKLPFHDRKIEADVRYSYYNPDYGENLATEIDMESITFGLQYFFGGNNKAVINYEIRDVKYNPDLENRIMFQITALFM